MSSNFLIGIDIGGSHISVGLVQNGSIFETVNRDFTANSASADDLIDLVILLINRLIDMKVASLSNITAIGIGCPGQCKDGVIVAASNFPKVRNLPIASIISKRFSGVPCFLLNDADAAMAAEIWNPSHLGSTPIRNAAMISK
jgi:glucokinase